MHLAHLGRVRDRVRVKVRVRVRMRGRVRIRERARVRVRASAHEGAQRRDGVGQEGVVDVRVEPVALVQGQHVGAQLGQPRRVGGVPVGVLGVEVPG